MSIIPDCVSCSGFEVKQDTAGQPKKGKPTLSRPEIG